MFIETTSHYESDDYSGSVGLGYGSIKGDEFTPITNNMITQNHIPKSIISLYFNETEAEIIFGGSNWAYCQPSAHYVYTNVSVQGHWQFHVNSIQLGSTIAACASGCTALIDTTSNTILGPPEDVFQINQILQTEDTFNSLSSLDCARIPDLPIIYFVLDGISVALTPRDYIWIRQDSTEMICMSLFKGYEVAKFAQQNVWHLGSPILQRFCTELDVSNHRIGFAPSNN